jgi:hypothetical protein
MADWPCFFEPVVAHHVRNVKGNKITLLKTGEPRREGGDPGPTIPVKGLKTSHQSLPINVSSTSNNAKLGTK